MQKWYAIRTFPGYENKVRENLEKKIKKENLEESIVDIYVPAYKKYIFVSRKLKMRQELVFPGYIFIKTELTNDILYTIRGVQYVTGYAGMNDNTKLPDPVEDDEIQRMQDETKDINIEIGKNSVVFYNDGFEKIEAIVKEVNLKNEEVEIEFDSKIKRVSFDSIEKFKKR